MKKALIGMAAGAMALGASAVPASAGDPIDATIWDGIESDACIGGPLSIFEQMVLIGGWGERLDTAGNGKPSYTVFAPYDAVINVVLDSLDTSIADLSSTPAAVAAVLADHIANGSFEEDELENPNLTRITMRSGYEATVSTWDPTGDRDIYVDVNIAGQIIANGELFGNGALYCIFGFIDSTPQVPTEGLNALDSPKDGTPGGTNSLPDTL